MQSVRRYAVGGDRLEVGGRRHARRRAENRKEERGHRKEKIEKRIEGISGKTLVKLFFYFLRIFFSKMSNFFQQQSVIQGKYLEPDLALQI